MRNHLLASVAAAALTLTLSGAFAQEPQRRPESGAPGAASPAGEGQRSGAPGRSERATPGEERSPQGQRASEGAGREGAGRNASERGQERGQGPASAQQNEERGAPATRGASDQQQQQQQRGSSSTAGGREEPGQRSPSAQSGEQRQPSSAQSGSDQKPGARDSGTRSTTTSGDQNRQGSDRPASAAGERDRAAPTTATSPGAERERATQGTSQTQPGTQTGQGSATSTTDTSASSRTGSSAQTSTNVQVRGELDVDRQAATRVHERLIRDTSARETNINITVDVGRNLPERVRLRPVPPEIVEISPRYRNYEYTIVRDDIVIVEPRTRKVVQIISSGGGRGGKASVVRLDTRQREMVKRDVLRTRTGATSRRDINVELRQGMALPERVMLQTFPEEVWREMPELREIRYVVIEDEVVLVDPDSREIIEIIR